MNIFKTRDIKELLKHQSESIQLSVVNRDKPVGANKLFKKLMQKNFRVIGIVSKENSIKDIESLLEKDIPDNLKKDTFYQSWISDMAQICELFSTINKSKAVDFCLSTVRGCRRYHIDHVPMRLLVTYAGKGTEWIPDEAADRKSFENGAPNEKILKDPLQRKFMETWDIAIFRGGSRGLLHRTPDAALNESSILLRLDHEYFWDKIIKQSKNSVLDMDINDIRT